MGNCINPHAMTWLDDEEWKSEEAEEEERASSVKFQGNQNREQKASTATSKEKIVLNDQVTIKMSKRQLVEVLRQAQQRGATSTLIEQVLPDPISVQGQNQREALESIPEVPPEEK